MNIRATVAMRCCLCGRQVWNPPIYIGGLPVGSVCAKRHGMLTLAQRGGSHMVQLATAGRASTRRRGDTQQNLELVPDEP